MDSQLDSLPAIGAYPSPGIANVLLAAADEAGIPVEIRGDALLESADTVSAAIHFDLTPWLPYLKVAGTYVAFKVLDGAFGEVGAEVLRRFGRMVNDTVDRAARKPFVDVIIHYDDDRGMRTYNLPGVDKEAAVAAILVDVGLEATHPLDNARFWHEGRWVGGHVALERERLGPAFVNSPDAPPRHETFAALHELRALLGADVRYVSRGCDIGIQLPPKTPPETIEKALQIVRRHLPMSVVGLSNIHKHIVVEDALQADAHDVATQPSLNAWPTSIVTQLPNRLYALCIDKHPTHKDEHTAIRYIGFAPASSAFGEAQYLLAVDDVLNVLDNQLSLLLSTDDADPTKDVRLISDVHDGRRYVKTEADDDLPNNLLRKRPLNQTEKLRLANPGPPGPGGDVKPAY